MSDSIYSPPEANLAPPRNDEPRFYVVSRTKFALLSVLTMGAYPSYWFYRNWKQIKLAENLSIWPIPRAIFSVFFVHSLFADVDAYMKRRGIVHEWHPIRAATLYVLLVVFTIVAGQLIPRGYLPAETYLLVLVSPFLYTAALLPGQKAINTAARDSGGTKNAVLTPANWIWMAIGLLAWIFNSIGIWSVYSVLTAASS